jgi:hypothetical protein
LRLLQGFNCTQIPGTTQTQCARIVGSSVPGVMSEQTLAYITAPCCAAVTIFICICAVRKLRPELFLAGPLAVFAKGLSPPERVEFGASGRAAKKKRKEEEAAAAEDLARKGERGVYLYSSVFVFCSCIPMRSLAFSADGTCCSHLSVMLYILGIQMFHCVHSIL